MRRPIVAGNWKMNLDAAGAVALAKGVREELAGVSDVEIGVCAPFPYLDAVSRALEGSAVFVGAQNVHWEEKGAFTGEVSGAMLCDVGCTYAIVGHSERRQCFGETDETVNKRLKGALAAGLRVIVCVGETLEQREADAWRDVVQRQMRGALEGIEPRQLGDVVIAYEPVWAIGTGRNATPEQAEEVHVYIRGVLAGQYDASAAEAMRIQYGGSMKPENAGDLLGQANIDGGLIGGASLDAQSFAAVVRAGSGA